MRNSLAIARRELGSYFNSPIAYFIVGVFLLFSGYLYFSQLFIENQADLRPFFSMTPLFLTFFVPAMTMRLIAEERSQGTFELLITLPISDWEVVVGKFLAGLGLLGVTIGLTMSYGITVASLGPLDKGPMIGGYLGLLLMGGAYVAIGVMASAWTRSQAVAFIVALGICLALFLFGKIVMVLPATLRPILEYVSIDAHFQNIERGVIDSRDLVYYASVIFVCLLVAKHSVESRKWR